MTEPIDAHLRADAHADKIREGTRPGKSTVAELADHNAPQTDLPAAEVDALGALPSDTALLVVVAEQYDSFHMTFYHGGFSDSSPVGSAAPLRKNMLTIPGITRKVAGSSNDPGADEYLPWRDSYFQLASMWQWNDDLIGWIHRLFTPGEPRTRLIVKDNTGFGIPWELYFKHSVPTGPNATPVRGWLGALIPVVRWTALHEGGLTNRREAEKKDCVAGMLVLEADNLGRLTESFDHFLAEPRTEDMRTLLRWLENRAGPFGLVMIRCHGSQADHQGRPVLCRIPYDEYAYKEYPALAHNGALVFLNACFGATPSGDPSELPATFSELFLRKGASGVIAATSDIDVDHSQDLAEDLLAAASQKSPLNIACWLLKWREEYAQKAEHAADLEPLKANESTFRRFFEAFKYVYFGHFDTTLHAIPANPEGQVA